MANEEPRAHFVRILGSTANPKGPIMNSLTFLTLFVCFMSGVFTGLYGRIKYLDEENN